MAFERACVVLDTLYKWSALEPSIASPAGTVTSSTTLNNGPGPAREPLPLKVDLMDVLHALPNQGLVFARPGSMFGMHEPTPRLLQGWMETMMWSVA